MNKKLHQIAYLILSGLIINSCSETELSCGLIVTKIAELNHRVGTFTSNVFSNQNTSNFEEAAINIQIEEVIMEESCDEESFTPVPQILESINITSSISVLSGGIEYSAGESLNQLFTLYVRQQVLSISEFITTQNDDPENIFSQTGDQIILQLLDRPDVSINQSFTVSFLFTDSEILTVDIPIFEVSN